MPAGRGARRRNPKTHIDVLEGGKVVLAPKRVEDKKREDDEKIPFQSEEMHGAEVIGVAYSIDEIANMIAYLVNEKPQEPFRERESGFVEDMRKVAFEEADKSPVDPKTASSKPEKDATKHTIIPDSQEHFIKNIVRSFVVHQNELIKRFNEEDMRLFLQTLHENAKTAKVKDDLTLLIHQLDESQEKKMRQKAVTEVVRMAVPELIKRIDPKKEESVDLTIQLLKDPKFRAEVNKPKGEKKAIPHDQLHALMSKVIEEHDELFFSRIKQENMGGALKFIALDTHFGRAVRERAKHELEPPKQPKKTSKPQVHTPPSERHEQEELPKPMEPRLEQPTKAETHEQVTTHAESPPSQTDPDKLTSLIKNMYSKEKIRYIPATVEFLQNYDSLVEAISHSPLFNVSKTTNKVIQNIIDNPEILFYIEKEGDLLTMRFLSKSKLVTRDIRRDAIIRLNRMVRSRRKEY